MRQVIVGRTATAESVTVLAFEYRLAEPGAAHGKVVLSLPMVRERGGWKPVGEAGRLVQSEISLGRCRSGIRQPQHRQKLDVRVHRHQTAAASDVVAEETGLGRRQGRIREHDDRSAVESGRGHRGQLRHRERVQPLGAKDLRQVRAVWVRRGAVDDHQNRWRRGLGMKPDAPGANHRQ